MIVAIPSRRTLAASVVVGFAAVFVAFYYFERNNLGLGHFYYLPIALLALAGGTWIGGLAGLTAAGLYAAGVVFSPRIPSTDAPSVQTAIRAVTFVSIGLLLGWFATVTRRMHAELTILAERDRLTGLPNTRSFEKTIGERLETGCRFVLLLTHVEHIAGEPGANDRLLRLVGDTLATHVKADETVARISDFEFAVIRTGCEPKVAAEEIEQALTGAGARATVGWATFPDDGENALSLYRVADEKLYARKIFNGYGRLDSEPEAEWHQSTSVY